MTKNRHKDRSMIAHTQQSSCPVFETPSDDDVPGMVDFVRTIANKGFLDGRKRPVVRFEIKPMEGQAPLSVIANARVSCSNPGWRSG